MNKEELIIMKRELMTVVKKIDRLITADLTACSNKLLLSKQVVDIKLIVDIWNEQEKLPKIRKITEKLKTGLRRLAKDYNIDDIAEVFKKYSKVLGDGYRWTYVWDLYSFITSKNGFDKFFYVDIETFREETIPTRKKYYGEELESMVMYKIAKFKGVAGNNTPKDYLRKIRDLKINDPGYNVIKSYYSKNEDLDPLLKGAIDNFLKENL